MSWQRLRGEFIDSSDGLKVIGRPTTGLLGLKRLPSRAERLAMGDELTIELSPDERGYVLLLVTIEPLDRTICLVPNAPGDARAIGVDDGFGYPEEADPRIVLAEPAGAHTVYAAVTDAPLPEELRQRIADCQGDCDRELLDAIAAMLSAAEGKRELHRRSFVVETR